MGLLATGTPLAWPEAKQKAKQVRDWGIQQLLATWRRAKDKERDALLWGDEVEYLVCCFDDQNKRVRLSLRQSDILEALAKNKALLRKGGGVPDLAEGSDKHGETAPTFHPEFGRFMLEATPGKPWGIDFKDLLDVEPDMKWRRQIAKDHMAPTEEPLTLTTFPSLGLPDTTRPAFPVSGDKLRSQFLPDQIANPHIRFPTLAANIRQRRGRKVEINVPVFKDEKTEWPFRDPTVDLDLHKWPEDADVRRGAAKDNHIYMDAMAFGMGSCCLQITFQAKNIEEGRKMYDQLSPLGPIMLALTAATPIYKGMLADTDVRWNQISRAVDDRTPEELGEVPLKESPFRVPKSRYASNSTYISQDPRLRADYHDPNLVVNHELRQRLLDGGMDSLLATHFAHLFIRDPIVIFNEDLQTLDLKAADHFENLQSTNWQHMRFKPPPPGLDIGWRVEFRPMEIQMTDFENAAFSIFIVLVTRAILSFDLNFYVPIQRTSENMETAHKRDAVLKEKFHFRNDPFSGAVAVSSPVSDSIIADTNGASGTLHGAHVNGIGESTNHTNGASPTVSSTQPLSPLGPVGDEYTLMTIDEIINGQQPRSPTATIRSNPLDPQREPQPQSHPLFAPATAATSSTNQPADPAPEPFPGLLPLVETYLTALNIDIETRCALACYLDLIRKRASGEYMTAAAWIRAFVRGHESYKGNSMVSPECVWELCKIAGQVGKGGKDEWELVGGMFGLHRGEGKQTGARAGEARGVDGEGVLRRNGGCG